MNRAEAKEIALSKPGGFVTWCETPPCNVTMEVHILSLAEAIFKAQQFLHASMPEPPVTTSDERLVCSTGFYDFLLCLPHFDAIHGTVLGIKVNHDESMLSPKAILYGPRRFVHLDINQAVLAHGVPPPTQEQMNAWFPPNGVPRGGGGIHVMD